MKAGSPAVRAGEGRGREGFVPVSWERALDLVAGELDRVKCNHGHDAIAGGSKDWGSAGIFHDARAQVRRFLSTFGGFVDQTSNYSFGTAFTFLPHVLGSAQAVTGPQAHEGRTLLPGRKVNDVAYRCDRCSRIGTGHLEQCPISGDFCLS